MKEVNPMKNTLWMNLEYGYLLTYDEMVTEAREMYDLDDDTNACRWSMYYTDTGEKVPDDWFDHEPDDIDDDMGFDPYEGCYTWDC